MEDVHRGRWRAPIIPPKQKICRRCGKDIYPPSRYCRVCYRLHKGPKVYVMRRARQRLLCR